MSTLPGFVSPGGNAYPDTRDPSYIPPTPGNVPGRSSQVAGNAVPSSGAKEPAISVRECNRYPRVVVLSYRVTSSTGFALVTEPNTTRILLAFRASSANTDNVLVGFGRSATDDGASTELPPGATIWLDQVVPQDDVYCSTASVDTQLVVITYANSPL